MSDFGSCAWCDIPVTIDDMIWKGASVGASGRPYLCKKCKTTPWGEIPNWIKLKLGYMNGAYDLEGVIWHQHSNKLMKKILELWPDKSRPVIDLGCGHNFYMTVMCMMGYEVIGYDAVDTLSKIQCSIDLCEDFNQDVVTEQFRGVGFMRHLFLKGSALRSEKRNVLSLEVGEHIPADKSAVYLNNVVKISNGGDIILSWAVLGQPGHGHINCQDGYWVIREMEKRGYEIDLFKTDNLRKAIDGCHCTWFLNTLMYFKPCPNY